MSIGMGTSPHRLPLLVVVLTVAMAAPAAVAGASDAATLMAAVPDATGTRPPPAAATTARVSPATAVAVANIVASLLIQLQGSGIASEALGGGTWACASAASGATGCGTTAAYLSKLLRTCSACGGGQSGGGNGHSRHRRRRSGGGGGRGRPVTVTPPLYDAPATVSGASCPACVRTATGARKCALKLLGIGSPVPGRSCRLVTAGGCWPRSSDRVLLACAAGDECRYKISGGRVGVWCCAAKEKSIFRRWRNVFRCSILAKAKKTRQKHVVVMWE